MRQKGVIHIASNYASQYGGNFIPSIVSLCNYLSKDYFIILSFPFEAENRGWICYIHSLGYKILFFSLKNKLKTIRDLRNINKLYKVNIFYSHFFSPLTSKCAIPFNKKRKLIIHVHSDFSAGKPINMKNKFLNFLCYRTIRKDAHFIFVSKFLMDKMHPLKCNHIPNAYCPDRIPCLKADKHDLIHRFSINDDNLVLLFFGWSPYVKGLDIMVKAYVDLPDLIKPKIKVIIVHKRDNGLAEAHKYLSNQIGKDYQREVNIFFIPPQEDILSLYEISDIFVSASRSEGYSYSILEALVNGLTIAMSDIDGTSWAKDYNSVFSFSNTGELSKLIVYLYENRELLKKSADIPFILEKYSINSWVKQIASIVYMEKHK